MKREFKNFFKEIYFHCNCNIVMYNEFLFGTPPYQEPIMRIFISKSPSTVTLLKKSSPMIRKKN